MDRLVYWLAQESQSTDVTLDWDKSVDQQLLNTVGRKAIRPSSLILELYIVQKTGTNESRENCLKHLWQDSLLTRKRVST